MIAAGHPDLTFELNLFSAVMPRHWKEPLDPPWFGTKEWAVGQGMQLRDSLQRLARRARSSTWPEYAELDCMACHHSLTAPKDSWRQEAATPDALRASRHGTPPASLSSATPRSKPTRLQPASWNRRSQCLRSLMGQLSGDREQIAASADRAAVLADSLTRQLNDRAYDQTFTLQIMRRIAADSRAISLQGQRAAEQATMSLDSLYNVCKQNGARTDDLQSAIRIIRAGTKPIGLQRARIYGVSSSGWEPRWAASRHR